MRRARLQDAHPVQQDSFPLTKGREFAPSALLARLRMLGRHHARRVPRVRSQRKCRVSVALEAGLVVWPQLPASSAVPASIHLLAGQVSAVCVTLVSTLPPLGLLVALLALLAHTPRPSGQQLQFTALRVSPGYIQSLIAPLIQPLALLALKVILVCKLRLHVGRVLWATSQAPLRRTLAHSAPLVHSLRSPVRPYVLLVLMVLTKQSWHRQVATAVYLENISQHRVRPHRRLASVARWEPIL